MFGSRLDERAQGDSSAFGCCGKFSSRHPGINVKLDGAGKFLAELAGNVAKFNKV
jgi:hypothetical protein